MESKAPVYVAGLLRGVRPIGDWSMTTSLSSCVRALHRPVGSRRAALLVVQMLIERADEHLVDERRLAAAASAGDGAKDPDGNADVDAAMLLAVALRISSQPRGSRRCLGIGMNLRPER